jgi:hypothetical protein
MNDLEDRDYFFLVAIGSLIGLLAVTSHPLLLRLLFAVSGSAACGFLYFYRRFL